MKKSELKEIIKSAYLAEYDDIKEQEDVDVEDDVNLDVKDEENVDVDVEMIDNKNRKDYGESFMDWSPKLDDYLT